ncbi:hypothetical protein M3Y99_01891300 [Aphelenchoides fujianensis]|nr:hypothetical protein M3Y99_01891300 [Aphelenchoides fujianensis]
MGDFEYSRRQFAAANSHFVLLLNLVESGLHTDGNVAQIVSDEVIAKIVHCFFETGMFTLAAVSGQLLAEVEWHLACIPGIVSQTPHTHDAGKDVFPFLYNMSIFEAMAEAYDRLNLNVYYMYLTKLCPTKAMTQANSADVLEEEKRRRRSRFLEVIFKSVRFQSNMQTRTALLML